jgi:molybdopterin/thiamine biosynthesis adenylyltransferase
LIYSHKFFRNPFSKDEQQKIRRFSFALIGLGGTGGFILENLLRSGAENILLYEDDSVELSNFNRQLLATESFIDKPKADAASERAKEINPSAKLRFKGRLESESKLGTARIIVDGSDNVKTKLAIARAARKKKIPFVFCSASGYRGIVTVFSRYRFEKAFQIDENLDYNTCASVLCPAAAIAGSLAASQAISSALGKPCIRAPEAVFFDLSKKKPFWEAQLG